MNIVGDEILAKIVEEFLFANMVGNELLAKIVKEFLFANMVGNDFNAKIVVKVVFVNMVGNELIVKIVKEVVFANMVGNELLAKIVNFVNMVCNEDNAKIAMKKIQKKTKVNFDRLSQLRKEFVIRVLPNYAPSIAILIGKYFFNNK